MFNRSQGRLNNLRSSLYSLTTGLLIKSKNKREDYVIKNMQYILKEYC